MANWRKPEERASETVTFRLRPDERRMLDHLVEVGGVGVSDLLRSMIKDRAEKLGIDKAPEPGPRRRPGRPRKPRGPAAEVAVAQPEARSEPTPDTAPEIGRPAPSPRGGSTPADCFDGLIERFDGHFGDRGEGTRRELAETVDFLTAPRTGGPILARETPLVGLDSRLLATVRARIAAAELRMPRKNLYLTYLRMMLQFAMKQEGPRPAVNPVLDLEPFTARELGSWPAPAVPDGEAP